MLARGDEQCWAIVIHIFGAHGKEDIQLGWSLASKDTAGCLVSQLIDHQKCTAYSRMPRVNPLSRTSGDGRGVKVYCHQGRRIPVPRNLCHSLSPGCALTAIIPYLFQHESRGRPCQSYTRLCLGALVT